MGDLPRMQMVYPLYMMNVDLPIKKNISYDKKSPIIGFNSESGNTVIAPLSCRVIDFYPDPNQFPDQDKAKAREKAFLAGARARWTVKTKTQISQSISIINVINGLESNPDMSNGILTGKTYPVDRGGYLGHVGAGPTFGSDLTWTCFLKIADEVEEQMNPVELAVELGAPIEWQDAAFTNQLAPEYLDKFPTDRPNGQFRASDRKMDVGALVLAGAAIWYFFKGSKKKK